MKPSGDEGSIKKLSDTRRDGAGGWLIIKEDIYASLSIFMRTTDIIWPRTMNKHAIEKGNGINITCIPPLRSKKGT